MGGIGSRTRTCRIGASSYLLGTHAQCAVRTREVYCQKLHVENVCGSSGVPPAAIGGSASESHFRSSVWHLRVRGSRRPRLSAWLSTYSSHGMELVFTAGATSCTHRFDTIYIECPAGGSAAQAKHKVVMQRWHLPHLPTTSAGPAPRYVLTLFVYGSCSMLG